MPADDPLHDDDTGPAVSPADRPSKTRRKLDSHDLQKLGEAMLELPDNRLSALPVPEVLLEAVREGQRIRSHEGRRRHMQYIGKLMRRIDAEPVRQAVDELRLGRAHDALALHEAERWRAELVADDAAATRWAAAHPEADLQQLRSLVRSARKDAAQAPEQRSGRAYRELFRYIRAHETPQDKTPEAAGAPQPGDGDDD